MASAASRGASAKSSSASTTAPAPSSSAAPSATASPSPIQYSYTLASGVVIYYTNLIPSGTPSPTVTPTAPAPSTTTLFGGSAYERTDKQSVTPNTQYSLSSCSITDPGFCAWSDKEFKGSQFVSHDANNITHQYLQPIGSNINDLSSSLLNHRAYATLVFKDYFANNNPPNGYNQVVCDPGDPNNQGAGAVSNLVGYTYVGGAMVNDSISGYVLTNSQCGGGTTI